MKKNVIVQHEQRQKRLLPRIFYIPVGKLARKILDRALGWLEAA